MGKDIRIHIPGEEINEPEADGHDEEVHPREDQIDDDIIDNSVEFIQEVDSEYDTESQSSEDEVIEGLSPWSPSPDLMIETITMGIEFSETVSVGVVANYLCDKLQEQGISKIRVSGESDADEAKEVGVDEEQIKSVINNALSDTQG